MSAFCFIDDFQQYVLYRLCGVLGGELMDISVDCVAVGAAYGTSKAGIGIAGLGSFKPELIMRVRSILSAPH
jgi:hypothetical protein